MLDKETLRRFRREDRAIVDVLYVNLNPDDTLKGTVLLEDKREDPKEPLDPYLKFMRGIEYLVSGFERSFNDIGFHGKEDNIRYNVVGINALTDETYAKVKFVEGLEAFVSEQKIDPGLIVIGLDYEKQVHDNSLARSIGEFASQDYQTLRAEYDMSSKQSVSNSRAEPRPELPILLRLPKLNRDQPHVPFVELCKTWNASGRIAHIGEVYEGPNLFMTQNPYSAHRLNDVTLRDWLNPQTAISVRAVVSLYKSHGIEAPTDTLKNLPGGRR